MKLLTEINPKVVEKCADILKVIAHPIRMSIVEMLHENEKLTVTEIHESLDIEQAVASHHLALLRNKNIISCSRNGKNMIYQLKIPKLYEVIACVKHCGMEMESGF